MSYTQWTTGTLRRLEAQYLEGYGYAEMARAAGRTAAQIKDALYRHGISGDHEKRLIRRTARKTKGCGA